MCKFLCFVIFNLFFLIIFVNSQELCSDIIKYTDEGNTRVGSVDIYLGQSQDNTLAEISVFVTDECEKSSCKLVPQLPLKKIKALYFDSERAPFKIVFSGQAKSSTVKAIGFKNSHECKILCTLANTLTPGGKILRYTFYPNGRPNSKKANCDHYKIYGRFRPPTGHFRTAVIKPDCGVPDPLPMPLAFHGQKTERGRWPWLVDIEAIGQNGIEFICGGTLVNQRIVVTAAHCLYRDTSDELREPNEISLFMGRYNRSDYNEQYFEQFGVESSIVHPDYRPRSLNFDADIGFLITDRIVKIGGYIIPACLWLGSEDINEVVGQEGTIVGWGIDETGNQTSIPYKVHQNIVSEDECEDTNLIVSQITTRRNFCAGSYNGSAPCKGDSGGAFLLKRDSKWMLRGIVAGTFFLMENHGEICDTTKHTIYTDVAKFIPWLHKETNKYFDMNLL